MPRAQRAAQMKHLLDATADSVGRYVLRQRTTRKTAAVAVSTEDSSSSLSHVPKEATATAAARGHRHSPTVNGGSRCDSITGETDKRRTTKKEAGENTAVTVKVEPGLPPPPHKRSRTARGDRKSHAVKMERELGTASGRLTTEMTETATAANLSTHTDASASAAVAQGIPVNTDVQHCVGAHVSAAGGVDKAVLNAKAIGCRAFALFLKSQRQWAAKPLEEDVAAKFRKACVEHNYPPHLILPHGSYLLNCGAPDSEILAKSRATLLDELQRCEKLGLLLYNFHPGSTCGEITAEQCMDRIAESINYAHSRTAYAITVIENMSCQGHTVGGMFEELASIINKVKDKSRVGVCIDTCHAFAAGYDLSTEVGYEAMINTFDSVVGLKYLRGMHLNDSKGTLGCHLDRHANIGKGCIGQDGFRRIMNDSRLRNIPLILETPFTSDEGYAEEIRLLYSLC